MMSFTNLSPPAQFPYTAVSLNNQAVTLHFFLGRHECKSGASKTSCSLAPQPVHRCVLGFVLERRQPIAANGRRNGTRTTRMSRKHQRSQVEKAMESSTIYKHLEINQPGWRNWQTRQT